MCRLTGEMTPVWTGTDSHRTGICATGEAEPLNSPASSCQKWWLCCPRHQRSLCTGSPHLQAQHTQGQRGGSIPNNALYKRGVGAVINKFNENPSLSKDNCWLIYSFYSSWTVHVRFSYSIKYTTSSFRWKLWSISRNDKIYEAWKCLFCSRFALCCKPKQIDCTNSTALKLHIGAQLQWKTPLFLSTSAKCGVNQRGLHSSARFL